MGRIALCSIKGIITQFSKEISGVMSITLTHAIANKLNSVTLYGGTEQRNLPSGYTQYEYLRSSGTQYIDLGYKGNGNTKVEVKFKYHTVTSATGSGRVFGSRITSSNNAFAIGTSSGVVSTSNNKVFRCYDGQPYYVDEEDTFGLDVWQTVVFSATEHTVNGTTVGDDYEITEFETPNNLLLFAFDNNGTVGVGYVDIAYCKLWNNGVLVRDLIPCKNGSNVLGMYDKVSETLLTNAGTGTFETGNNATPTPEKPMNIVCNNGVLKFSKNMANVNTQTILLGYYISSSGVVTADANNRIYQEYIPCKPNTTYTLSLSSEVYYVTISEYSTTDDSGFIRRNAGTSGGNTQLTITTSATTNYVRFGTNIDRTEITLEEVLAINWMLNKGDTMPYTPYSPTGIYTDGTVETIEDELSNTATAEMLLKVGDNADEQDIISGDIIRKVDIKVLDGTETWTMTSPSSSITFATFNLTLGTTAAGGLSNVPLCSHFRSATSTGRSSIPDNGVGVTTNSTYTSMWFRCDTYESTTDWTNFLKDQYNAGTPVIVVYPLATPTTESVTGQTLNIQAGTNTIDITQASLNNLELKANYYSTSA